MRTELDGLIHWRRRLITGISESIFRTDQSRATVVRELDDDAIRVVIGFMALAYGEWIQIHPFANGNGRTARRWANRVAMRSGLTPFVSLRPRPGRRYEWATFMSIRGNWQAMRPVFEEMFDDRASEESAG